MARHLTAAALAAILALTTGAGADATADPPPRDRAPAALPAAPSERPHIQAAGSGDPARTAAKNMPAWAMVPYPAPRSAAPASAPRPAAGPNLEGLVALAARPPRPRRRVPPSCSPDGAHCISPVAYTRDVCRILDATAREAGLDPDFFARLIWQESLFAPYAISPAGALGIAQFMPGTARLRGLQDPFNPAAALQASAHYLAELRDRFGNIGLAAVAYNGGEARAARFAKRASLLPSETRNYVRTITGISAPAWRDSPPEAFDLSLDPSQPFQPACIAWAEGRSSGPGMPAPGWRMIYAAHPDRDIALQRRDGMRRDYPDLLDDAPEDLDRARLPGRAQEYYTAAIRHPTEGAARGHCSQLRQAGGGCMVLRD